MLAPWLWLAPAAAVPFVLEGHALHVVSIASLYTTLGLGLSIVVSRAGLLDLGYIAFFAVGAYTYAIADRAANIPSLLLLPASALTAGAAGIVLAVPTLRVRGDYLALVTLAFGEIAHQVLQNATSLTNGPRGISGVSSLSFAGVSASVPRGYSLVCLALLAVVVAGSTRLDRLTLSLAWRAIRDDEIAASCSGVAVNRSLVGAFWLATSLAGLTGAVFASIQRFVSPESFVLTESILVLSIVVLSGGRRPLHIAIATIVLVAAPEYLRYFASYRPLVFGSLLIVFVVVGHLTRSAAAARSKGSAAPGPATSRDQPTSPPVSRRASLVPRRAAATISVRGLCVNFAGVRALDAASFDVDLANHIVGLIGPNGAGKTTLFNCMTGLIRPDAGTITLQDGTTLHRAPPHRVARSGVARTFQTPRVFTSMTVRENVRVAAASCCRWRGRAQIAMAVDSALDAAGLLAISDEPTSHLPLGVIRHLELARAVATGPRLLLLDEVASGLNDEEKRELASRLAGLRESMGTSMILVEHDIPFVLSLASELIVLDSGRVIVQGAPDTVLADERVLSSYLGPEGAL